MSEENIEEATEVPMSKPTDVFKASFNYGVVVKGTAKQINELQEWIKQQDLYFIFDKISANGIWLQDK